MLVREDSQIDFFTQSVFWTLGGWGVLPVDALKKSVKNRFLSSDVCICYCYFFVTPR